MRQLAIVLIGTVCVTATFMATSALIHVGQQAYKKYKTPEDDNTDGSEQGAQNQDVTVQGSERT